MEVAIHDRTHHVPAEDISYAQGKLSTIAGRFDLVARAELEFDRDLKKRPHPLYVVKVQLYLIGHRLSDLRAHETGRDLRATVDLLMDKIDGELTTLKERVKAHP
ncbi:MAG TPA: HPF/RaiA family ribosome-associated protein [Candidatus Baltobacterales bacterium]|nr:HPF/RaiA family ribosome-associated protein [Candidatus Baltobacterales bacterium]